MALKLEMDTLGNGNFIDFTSSLAHGSLVVCLNTVDFQLIGAATPSIGSVVRISALSWLGTLVSRESRDAVEIRGQPAIDSYTATNTNAAFPPVGSSMSLSDQPTTVTDTILLEDGSGGIALEDGSLTEPGLIEMEGALVGYQRLSVRVQTNGIPVGIFGAPGTSTLGKLTTFQGGLWPGIQFTLTSTNQAIAANLYTVTEVRITWPADPARPFFEVTFGSSSVANDVPWTLRTWTQALIHG